MNRALEGFIIDLEYLAIALRVIAQRLGMRAASFKGDDMLTAQADVLRQAASRVSGVIGVLKAGGA